MESIKPNHALNSGLHNPNSLTKNHAMQQQCEWYETCLRDTQLDGSHTQTPIFTKGQQLQLAYRQWIQGYSPWLQYAVTLTVKPTDKIRVKRFENYGDDRFDSLMCLDEEKLKSTISYFTTLLRYELYGNMGKNKNKRDRATPLVITAIEGRNTHKRTHVHLAIGNVPDSKTADFDATIARLWHRCDFADHETCTKPITNADGWLSYITKEVGYTDNDALDIDCSTIPPFIQQSIRT
jgi:hypothetical protein